MFNFSKGDLVFIPSQVTLVQFNHDSYSRDEAPNKWFRTEKPSHALAVGYEKDWEPYCKILYKGQYWFVNEKNIMECD